MKLFSAEIGTAIALVSLSALAGKCDGQMDWEPYMELKPKQADNPALFPDHGFGWQVAISGNTGLIGSRHSGQRQNDGTTKPGYGNARVFDLTTGDQELLVPDDGVGNTKEYLGFTVALDGDTAIMGVYNEVDYRGMAFIFVRDPGTGAWSQQAILDTFVQEIVPRVALDGDTAVIGLPSQPIGGGKGEVRVYVRSGTSWSLQQTLQGSDGKNTDQLGTAVDISADFIIAGGIQIGGQGKAYIWMRTGSTWTEKKILTPLAGAPAALDFGGVVAIDGDLALVSAAPGPTAGFDVYVYHHSGGGNWAYETKIDQKFDNGSPICFGCSVSLKGAHAVVGAMDFKYSGGKANGNAYFFERTPAGWKHKGSFHDSTGMFLGAKVAMGDGRALVSAEGAAGFGNANGRVAGSVFVFREVTPSPTLSPTTMEPTPSPTPACVDDDTFMIKEENKRGKKKLRKVTCKSLRGKRRNKYCKLVGFRYFCPKTCDSCDSVCEVD